MSSSKFPFAVTPLDSKLEEKFRSLFLGASHGLVQIGPERYFFYSKYGQVAETIYNFQVRSDDVWIVSLPRSGTTLTQEIIWNILNDDYDTARKIGLGERFPFLEFSTLVSDEVITKMKNEMSSDEGRLSKFLNKVRPQWEVLQNVSGRRFIKTHLPPSLLPPALFKSGAKVIYVARNPKDVAVSRYNQNRSLRTSDFVGDFGDYWDLFENNLIPYSPYWAHIEEGWQRRNDKNFHFIFYEDIVKYFRNRLTCYEPIDQLNFGRYYLGRLHHWYMNLYLIEKMEDYKKAIIEVSNFLEKDMNSEQISELEKFLQVETFRTVQNRNDNIRSFFSMDSSYDHIRVGKSGNWTDHFNEQLNDRANKWVKENYKSTTIRFPINLDKVPHQ